MLGGERSGLDRHEHIIVVGCGRVGVGAGPGLLTVGPRGGGRGPARVRVRAPARSISAAARSQGEVLAAGRARARGNRAGRRPRRGHELRLRERGRRPRRPRRSTRSRTWSSATTIRARGRIHEAFGLQMVSSTAWGAQRIEELLQHGACGACSRPGNGEVQVYETASCPTTWHGRPLGELSPGIGCVAVRVTRAGRDAPCRRRIVLLEPGDVLHVSATGRGSTSCGAASRPRRRRADDVRRSSPAAAGPARTLADVLAGAEARGARRRAPRATCCRTSTASCRPRSIYEGNATDPRSSRPPASRTPRCRGARSASDADNLALCFVRARSLQGAAHHRRRQQPAQRVAVRPEVPRRRRAQPGRDPRQPDRGGDVAGRHDDAAQAAPRTATRWSRRRSRTARAPWASRSRSSRCRRNSVIAAVHPAARS